MKNRVTSGKILSRTSLAALMLLSGVGAKAGDPVQEDSPAQSRFSPPQMHELQYKLGNILKSMGCRHLLSYRYMNESAVDRIDWIAKRMDRASITKTLSRFPPTPDEMKQIDELFETSLEMLHIVPEYKAVKTQSDEIYYKTRMLTGVFSQIQDRFCSIRDSEKVTRLTLQLEYTAMNYMSALKDVMPNEQWTPEFEAKMKQIVSDHEEEVEKVRSNTRDIRQARKDERKNRREAPQGHEVPLSSGVGQKKLGKNPEDKRANLQKKLRSKVEKLANQRKGGM